jgi:hypothetical protein
MYYVVDLAKEKLEKLFGGKKVVSGENKEVELVVE